MLKEFVVELISIAICTVILTIVGGLGDLSEITGLFRIRFQNGLYIYALVFGISTTYAHDRVFGISKATFGTKLIIFTTDFLIALITDRCLAHFYCEYSMRSVKRSPQCRPQGFQKIVYLSIMSLCTVAKLRSLSNLVLGMVNTVMSWFEDEPL